MNNQAWIISDGDRSSLSAFYYGKGRWGQNRNEAKIYVDKNEAEKTALRLDSNIFEIKIEENYYRKFTVLEWAK